MKFARGVMDLIIRFMNFFRVLIWDCLAQIISYDNATRQIEEQFQFVRTTAGFRGPIFAG